MKQSLVFFLCLLVAQLLWAQSGEGYDPVSPDDPFADGYRHKVTLYATPSAGGSFNSKSFFMSEGKTTKLYAYPSSSYRFVSWKQNGKIVSTDNPLEVVMEKEDMEFTAQFVYDPTNPANPGANSFDKTTGELIIDDFEPGRLSSAIYSVLGGDANYKNVKKITIIGSMKAGDFGFVKNMTNCVVADISRTIGYNNVPDYAFANAHALKTIILPYSVESIGRYAFSGCSNLALLYCYATTPPTIASTSFGGVPTTMKVLVPSLSLELYQSKDYWKNFVCSALDGVTNTLTISLPANSKDGRYKNMTLELNNVTSGQVSRMLITDRSRYSFVNLIHNTKYNVYVKTAKSVVLGELRDIEITDKDVDTAFVKLKEPKTVQAIVVNKKGEDLTAGTNVTWYDNDGNYLHTGNTVSGYVEGTSLRCRVTLSDTTALRYVAPQDTTYMVKAETNRLTCVLTPLQLVTLTGCVKSNSTKRGIYDASVSISQQNSGKQKRTVVARTDANGVFTAEVYNAPANVSCAAYNYVSKSLDIKSVAVKEGKATADDILLDPIVGATINASVAYQESVLEGETPSKQDWYSDYLNLDMSVYNLATGKRLTQISNRYPQFVVMGGAKVGDELKLILSSKKNAFEPVVIDKAVVDSTEMVNGSFTVKQFGGVRASYKTTKNTAVVAMLYGSDGSLMQTQDFSSDNTVSFGELRDGEYTLVAMGKNPTYNSIYKLSRLRDAGLTDNVDYVKSQVKVESGLIKSLSVANVPLLNLAKFQTIDNKRSSLTINRSSVVVGSYLTFTGTVELQANKAESVDALSLVVDIPSSALFVRGSVMVGDKVVENYSLSGNSLTVPLDNAEKLNKVKFCVVPTQTGNFQPNAMVAFNLEGEKVMIPIGAANYDAKDLSISVPLSTARTTITINGTATGTSKVEVYDNDVLIGQTVSNANGTWVAKCELYKPYNLSSHSIYAKVTTKQGIELISKIQKCYFDSYAIEAKTVKMSFYNGWLKKNINVTFDLLNKTADVSSYSFYNATDFTFVADLTNNDTTIVSDVKIKVFTDHGNSRTLATTYDSATDKWVAISRFDSKDLPVGVKVLFQSNTPNVVDRGMIQSVDDEIKNLVSTHRKEALEIENDTFDLYDYEADEEFMSFLNSLTEEEKESLINDTTDVVSYLEKSKKLSEFADSIFASDFSTVTAERGITVTNNPYVEYSSEELQEMGFAEYQITDGNTIYIKRDGETLSFIDKTTHEYYSVYAPQADVSNSLNMPKGITSDDLRDRLLAFTTTITGALSSIQSKYDEVEEKFGDLLKIFEENTKEAKYVIRCQSFTIKQKSKKLARLESELAGESDKLQQQLKQKEIAKVREEISEANKYLTEANKKLKAAENAIKDVKYFKGWIGKTLPFAKYMIMANNAISNMKKVADLAGRIPEECSCYPQELAIAEAELLAFFGTEASYIGGRFAIEIVNDFSTASGLVATGGSALPLVSLKNLAKKILIDMAVDLVHDKAFDAWNRRMTNVVSNLRKKCSKKKCDDDDDNKKDDDNNDTDNDDGDEPNPKVPPIRDPSGFVYEGVFNNRVEGVTTTCFQKTQVEDMYGDLHDHIVKWNAEEYGQENPLYTDKDGFYQWFVPEGLWQVKYEKEGYETAYSQWLPVPPPQLDVNIGIVQNSQPMIKEAHAYKDGIELTFDKYMMLAYLTAENIKVSQNGKYVAGKVMLLDEEVAYRDEHVKYVSCLRFVPDREFSAGKEVSVVVANRVKSYAGIPMAETYTQSFDIEKEVKSIVADSMVKIPYQGSKSITLRVEPAEAAVGRVVHAVSSSDAFISFVHKSVTVDNKGMAQFEVNGDLPGTAGVTFGIDGVRTTATVIVNIGDFVQPIVKKPVASLASGTSVYRGTKVTLSADGDNLKIWYTTDGSCPCDENGSRKQYVGPITINDGVTLKAMAQTSEGDVSEVATFDYYIVQSKAGVSLSAGWSWVSLNMKSDALASVNKAMASGTWLSDDAIKDNKNVDMYSVNNKQWVGTLSKQGALNNTQMYKIHSAKSQVLNLAGEAINPQETPLTVGPGWNYISYLPLVNMSVGEALKGYKAQNGDVIKSQDAFATYSASNGWEGDLKVMAVGQGYMLKRSASASQTTFVYPNGSENASANPTTTHVGSHRFADNMNVVGEIEGFSVADGDSIIAYSKGEVRGATCVESAEKVFLTIHGDDEAKITLVIQRDGEIVAVAKDQIAYQSNSVIGSGDMPTSIRFVSETQDGFSSASHIKAVYNIHGIRMATTRLADLHPGTYVIYSENNGITHVSKYYKK